jgi:TolB-like protein/DNA-binding winged helix-turn-helix (wHTH) protein
MNSMVGGGHSGVVAPMFARPAYQPTAHPVARIHLFGPMRGTSYLGDDILPRAKKSRALLSYLCLAFGQKVSRARLTSMLWDESADEQARHSFRHALSEVTAAMGALAEELIVPRRGTVSLNANACWIDALALLEPSSPNALSIDLARLCDGTLLQGLDGISKPFDRWVLNQQTRATEKLRALLDSPPTRAPARKAPARAARPDSVPHRPLPGRNRLRVAVMPFQAKGTQREETLASSLSHEISAALARFRWFDVISPVQVLRRPLVRFTSEDLHQLDYAVDGVVSRHGRLLEITVRLVDLTRSTQPVWSERFELAIDELHRLNEMVTPRVVASIDPVILFIEGQPKRRENYGATGLLLLAIPLIYSMERRKFEQAGELINRALGIDPQNAMALAWSAIWHITRCGHGWAQDIAGALAQAEAASLKAIELDSENAEALGIYAHTCSWKKDYDTAVQYFNRSLRLNPNLAFVWSLSAVTYCYIGEPNEALKRLKRYHELAPFDPYSSFYDTIYVIAYTLKGDYEQAVLVGRGVVKVNPDFSASYKPLIAALGHLGRTEEAKPYIAKLLSLEPNFTVERFGQVYPLRKPSDREHYMAGLLLAGVPPSDAT